MQAMGAQGGRQGEAAAGNVGESQQGSIAMLGRFDLRNGQLVAHHNVVVQFYASEHALQCIRNRTSFVFRVFSRLYLACDYSTTMRSQLD